METNELGRMLLAVWDHNEVQSFRTKYLPCLLVTLADETELSREYILVRWQFRFLDVFQSCNH